MRPQSSISSWSAWRSAWPGGPTSVLFPWLILPVLANAPRLRPRVLVALTVAVVADCGIVVGVRGDIRTANDLLPLLVIATLFVSCTAGAYVLSSAEMRQRTAAVLDPLTGLLNRKTLSGRAAELAAQAQVTAQPLACITADIDCFKKINDEHGHAHGDSCCGPSPTEYRKELGGFESLYRTGGEEFLVLLPGLDAAAAVMVGERVRQAARTVRVGDAPVTVSVGVATALGASIDIRALFHRADLALYRAKAQGRDCLCSSTARRRLCRRRARIPNASGSGCGSSLRVQPGARRTVRRCSPRPLSFSGIPRVRPLRTPGRSRSSCSRRRASTGRLPRNS